ncbi:MAG TPA: hypothetical protein VHA52_09885 [Candidatus Babeliaceae bacterium]|nr:hypothetical protein [Candidatus Babeliaceae bacterium]
MLLAALLCGILMPITQETIIIPEGMNLVSADDINFEEIEEILNIQPSVIND